MPIVRYRLTKSNSLWDKHLNDAETVDGRPQAGRRRISQRRGLSCGWPAHSAMTRISCPDTHAP